jgi:hypothetical protein
LTVGELSVAKKTENPLISNRCSFLAEEYQSIAAMLGDDEPEAASALKGRRPQARSSKGGLLMARLLSAVSRH